VDIEQATHRHVRPLLRGHLHAVAATVSVGALVLLVRSAASVEAKVAAWIYGVAAILCYATSFAYNALARSPRARLILRRADHSMIYVLIAGSATPVSLLSMTGWARWAVIGTVWTGAALGVALCIVPRPKLGPALYIILGWGGVAVAPSLMTQPVRLALLVAAGLVYTTGAVLFGMQRPRLRPQVFGYHEFWHAIGVAAGALVFVLNFSLITSATP
jgi:hemolysin III